MIVSDMMRPDGRVFLKSEWGPISEAARMANLITERIRRGGEPRVSINPQRSAPNFSDRYALLTRLWQVRQGGLCALCGSALIAPTTNPMMQPSADRIDSEDGSYGEANVQVTHLACNLAKNKYNLKQFEEWLALLRDGQVLSEVPLPSDNVEPSILPPRLEMP